MQPATRTLSWPMVGSPCLLGSPWSEHPGAGFGLLDNRQFWQIQTVSPEVSIEQNAQAHSVRNMYTSLGLTCKLFLVFTFRLLKHLVFRSFALLGILCKTLPKVHHSISQQFSLMGMAALCFSLDLMGCPVDRAGTLNVYLACKSV